MNNELILTIDVGTGSGRALLFNQKGEQVAMGQREWLPEPVPEYPGASSFNTGVSWGLLIECIREALEKSAAGPESIAAVTATSMREGMVLYDKEGREIWACPNADARARREVEEMNESGLSEKIYRTGGDWPTLISPARFRWIERHQPDMYRAVAHMNMLSDWVLYKLSGEIVTDVSSGSSSGLFNLQERTWSQELIGEIGLPGGIYPQVVEPGTIIGRVTADAARQTGLREGTPVVASGADTQLALLGTGAVTPGQFTVVAGTFWQTAIVADTALIDPKIRTRTLCHVMPGQWMVEGIGFFIGFSMRWFRDAFCDSEMREAVERGVNPYAIMEEKAARIPPGSGGVQALFSNVMNARCWKHGTPSFMGFDLMRPAETGKAACIRAIQEHAAYSSRAHYEILNEISGYKPDVITFCGGSSNGFLWPQIEADVLGFPMRVPHVPEATSLGSFFCSAAALGWFGSMTEAAEKIVRYEKTFEPDPERVEQYHGLYQQWRKAYAYAQAAADDEVLPSMWRAPGS